MPFDPTQVREFPLQGTPADVATATHAAAVVTYGAPGVGYCHGVNSITVGFSATPTSPVAFTIKDGTNVVFSAEVAAAGSVTFSFGAGKLGSPNNAMVLTLPDGGSGIVGSVSVGEHFLLANQYQAMAGMDFTNAANDCYLGCF